VHIRADNRSGETLFGQAKNELRRYSENMRAIVLECKLKIKQFSVARIEMAMDKFWSRLQLTRRARKVLDSQATQRQLDRKRILTLNDKLADEEARQAVDRQRKNLTKMVKTFLEMEGWLKGGKLTNDSIMAYLTANRLTIHGKTRSRLLESMIDPIQAWFRQTHQQMRMTQPLYAELRVE
jgi:hypothetical protein